MVIANGNPGAEKNVLLQFHAVDILFFSLLRNGQRGLKSFL
jgi:hypothetical protein